MAKYIRVPIETDPLVLAQDAYDYITVRAPNWTPNDGNLDVWIIQAMTANAAETRDLASDVLDTIYRDFGSSLIGIPPLDASPATGTTTWSVRDNLGYTISAGTQVSIKGPDGPVGFTVVQDVVIPAGQVTTAGGAVTISAIDPGVAGNLGSANQQIDLIDVLDYVTTVVLVAPTSGGVDAEDDEDYLDRLVRRLRRLSQRPILPVDFSEMAKDADPAVYRAVAIDGYNPANSSYSNERMITVSAIDINGVEVPSTIQTKVQTYLDTNREVNFVVNYMHPNFNPITVTAVVVAIYGYDKTALQATVIQGIKDYLSPAVWGRDPQYTDASGNNTWVDLTTLYYNDMIGAIDRIEGVARVSDLQICKQGGTLARTDVTLTGPASLVQPGTAINVTVN